jgi:hypothetical protein
MPLRCIVLSSVAAFLVGAGSCAAAEQSVLAQLVGPLHRQGKSFGCYVKRYGAGYLAAHPGQRVTFVKALIAGYYRTDVAGRNGAYEYQVSLAFRFRDRPETLSTVAECGEGQRTDPARSGIVCAGPGEKSYLTVRGRNLSIVMPGGADLWMPGPVDQRHEVVKNPFGSKDEAFHLSLGRLKPCEDLAFDDWKPLRPYRR